MYRKNTAGQNLSFVLVNASSGAALTGATVTARRTIDGGAQAAATGTVSELANGEYNLALSQADTNGNEIGILLTATNAIPVHFTLITTAADPTDAVRFGLSALPNAAAGATGGLDCAVSLGGTASAGGNTTITLAGGSTVDNYYNHQIVQITAGTGLGQANVIVGYVGSTKVATVGRAWKTNPDNTSVFQVKPPIVMSPWNLLEGTLSAATATTATLAGGMATNNYYNGATLYIGAGTGAGQARVITGYVGSTLVATVDHAWATTPDNTSVFVVLATDLPATDGSGDLSGSVGSVVSGVTVTTNNDKTGYSLANNAVDAAQFTQAAADKVWSSTTRTLSAFAQGFSDQTWSSATRTLTAFAQGFSDQVWSSATRTLTAFAQGFSDQVWSTAARTLTAFGFSVTVGTNNDKTGYSLANNAVDAAQFTQAAADKVWSSATRTLTAFAQGFADLVWSSVTRTLTAFGFSVTVGTNNDKTGYSLTVAPPTAAQIDTQLSGTHGAGQWGGASGMGANQVTLTVQSSLAVPIANVPITVKNQAQTAIVATGTSDVNGQVVVNLNNGTYTVLILSSPSWTPPTPQTLVVSGTTAATYTLTAFNPGTPASASLCRVYGTLRNLDGSAASGQQVAFTLDSGDWQANDTAIVVAALYVTTDVNGYFQADLTRSSQFSAIHGSGIPRYNVSGGSLRNSFLAPDQNSADLLTLL
jgi:hypothetical protein